MTRNLIVKIQIAALLLATMFASAQSAPSPQSAADRAEKILKQMTLEEKVAYVGGLNDFYIRAIPRLSVPELKMSDGPIGLRNDGKATAYPAGIALAASWDESLAKEFGASLGR